MKERNCIVKFSIKKKVYNICYKYCSIIIIQYNYLLNLVKLKVYSFGNVKYFFDNMEKQGRFLLVNKEDIGDLQLLINGCLSFKGVKLS